MTGHVAHSMAHLGGTQQGTSQETGNAVGQIAGHKPKHRAHSKALGSSRHRTVSLRAAVEEEGTGGHCGWAEDKGGTRDYHRGNSCGPIGAEPPTPVLSRQGRT